MMPSTPDDDDVYTGEFTLHGARRRRERELERARGEWLEPMEDGSGVDSNTEVIAACEAAYAAAVLVSDAKFAATEAAVSARLVYQRVSDAAR